MTPLAERPIQEQPRWSKRFSRPMTAPAMAIDPLQSTRYPVTSAPGAVAALRATVPGGKVDQAKRADAVELDPAPTADALTAVQVAAQAYEVLKKAGRELRFETSPEGVMRIEVFDGNGRLVRSIPPNEALALASGEASWQA
jgi:hypothetical protein